MKTTPRARRAAYAVAAALVTGLALAGPTNAADDAAGTTAGSTADSTATSTADTTAGPAARGKKVPARVLTDVAYTDPVPADTRGNLLDLYLPERRKNQKLPLFIYSEGSAWFGDNGKDTADAWAERLAPHGYAVAGVSVRNSSQVQFPGQVHDIKAAIRYLRKKAGRLGLDRRRFAIGGFSSGAWTAAIAGTTGDVKRLEGYQGVRGPSSRVQAVVTLSPPTAFRKMDSQATEWSVLEHETPDSPESRMTGCTQYETGIGDPRCHNARLANPLRYVSRDDPPFLMFHGSRDQLLPPGQSQVLFDRLASRCVEATYHLVEGPDHQYRYLADPAAGPVLGQTVSTVDDGARRGCSTSTSSASAPLGDAGPSYDLVADFLDAALAR
ncbi:alpha/beta hydrolase [Nocardioides sp. 31GB23]|uniref:alpha/beta hydrolase n=1 Tax=Nocardioides sp. 31GB23 TaxID=3156065 RepID=UPI0032AFE532